MWEGKHIRIYFVYNYIFIYKQILPEYDSANNDKLLSDAYNDTFLW